jgi:hypothetical protein
VGDSGFGDVAARGHILHPGQGPLPHSTILAQEEASFSQIFALTSTQSGAIKGKTSACATFHHEREATQSRGAKLQSRVVGNESEKIFRRVGRHCTFLFNVGRSSEN